MRSFTICQQIKKDKMGGASRGERRSAYSVLVRKAAGKTPLGSPRYRWEDNIKMDRKEMG